MVWSNQYILSFLWPTSPRRGRRGEASPKWVNRIDNSNDLLHLHLDFLISSFLIKILFIEFDSTWLDSISYQAQVFSSLPEKWTTDSLSIYCLFGQDLFTPFYPSIRYEHVKCECVSMCVCVYVWKVISNFKLKCLLRIQICLQKKVKQNLPSSLSSLYIDQPIDLLVIEKRKNSRAQARSEPSIYWFNHSMNVYVHRPSFRNPLSMYISTMFETRIAQ